MTDIDKEQLEREKSKVRKLVEYLIEQDNITLWPSLRGSTDEQKAQDREAQIVNTVNDFIEVMNK